MSDNHENTQTSCSLLVATEVSTAGFDHRVDGGAASDGPPSGRKPFPGDSLSCLVSLMREQVLHL